MSLYFKTIFNASQWRLVCNLQRRRFTNLHNCRKTSSGRCESLKFPSNFRRMADKTTVRGNRVEQSPSRPSNPNENNVDRSSISSFEHIEAGDLSACESVSDLREIDFKKECPDQLNMSFAGCGFLGIYHLGAVKALQTYGKGLLNKVDMFGGASAGALVSTLVALKMDDPYIVQECVEWCLENAELAQKCRGGILNPSICLMSRLREFLHSHMPDDSHIKASKRVFISVTEKSSNKNVIVCEYESKEDLIECMLASSYVPLVTGKKTVTWKGKKYIDGGMTDNLPVLAQGRTILVTPFSGSRKDICPIDSTKTNWNVTINKENYLVNFSNIVRGLHAFFPPKVKHLKSYFEMGQRDAIRFLKGGSMFDDGAGEAKVLSVHQLERRPDLKGSGQNLTASCSSLQYESAV